MSYVSAVDDWGLPGVADVLEDDDNVRVAEMRDGAENAPSDEVGSPDATLSFDLLLNDDALLERSTLLINMMRQAKRARWIPVERAFRDHAVHLQHALRSAHQLRDKLRGIQCDLLNQSNDNDSSYARQRVSVLSLLTLLVQCGPEGLMTCDGPELFETCARSCSNIDTATPRACSDIYYELYKYCVSNADVLIKSEVAITLLRLAERSGSLSALLSCMLLVRDRCSNCAREEMHAVSATSFADDRLPPYFGNSTYENFITRGCVLPKRTMSSTTFICLPRCSADGSPDALYVLTRDSGEIDMYDCLGAMNTRLRHCVRRLVCSPQNCVALAIRNNALRLLLSSDPTTRRGGAARGVYTLEFRTVSLPLSPTTTSSARHMDDDTVRHAPTRIVVDYASSGDHEHGGGGGGVNNMLFALGDDCVACLLCKPSLAAPARSRCYVAECALSDDAQEVMCMMDDRVCSEQVLLREAHPGRKYDEGARALHFTEHATAALGKVTLKEELHPFCIELWVQPRSVSEPQTILCIGDRSVDEVLLELLPSDDGITWRGGARTPQLGPSFATHSAPGRLTSVERWWHVALNFTGTMWELWLDMNLVARHPALTARTPLRQCTCTLGRNFVGFIAELRVWQVCRSATQLRRDAHRGLLGNEHGLVAYFPLNEGQGNVLLDLSPTAAHALLPSFSNTTTLTPTWCNVQHYPIAYDDDTTRRRRRVADFAPLAARDTDDVAAATTGTEGVYFALTPRHYIIAVAGRKSSAIIFQYDRTGAARRVLRSQVTIDLPVSWRLGGVVYNTAWQSLLCWAVVRGAVSTQTSRLMVWDVMMCCVHDEVMSCQPPDTARDGECDVWTLSRAILLRSATHAMRLLRPERYLADVSAWTVATQPLVVDDDPNTLSRLVSIATAARKMGDVNLIHAVCTLLHINLLLRLEGLGGPGDKQRRRQLEAELGCELYTGMSTLLGMIGASDDGGAHGECVAKTLLQLAFMPSVASSGLLQVCCRCFLTTHACVEYVRTVTNRLRSAQEEQLLTGLLYHFSGLSACDELLQSTELAQSFYTALMSEAAFQLAQRTGFTQTAELRGTQRDEESAALRRVTRALEVFQELLLVQAVQQCAHHDASSSSPRLTAARTVILTYCNKLLAVCCEMSEQVLRALRRGGVDARRLVHSFEMSPVGALLPSFTLSLPHLPILVLSTCVTKLQACRETFISIRAALVGGAGLVQCGGDDDEAQRWLSQLGVALTFSLCLVGYSLMSATANGVRGMSRTERDTAVLGAGEMDEDDNDDEEEDRRVIRAVGGWRVMALLKGGRRRGDGERDELIRNLQQGIGAAARAFDELRHSKPNALRVARDETLERAERNITAAFCALTVPTRQLREASLPVLEPVYLRVQKVRAWLLARRQSSATDVHAVSERAIFLAQFETCCKDGLESTPDAGVRSAARLPHHHHPPSPQQQQHFIFRPGSVGGRKGRREAGDGSASQHSWRRFFRTWKAMRILRTLLSAGEDSRSDRVSDDITAFLQGDVSRAELERFVARRTTRAHYRLAGLHLLRQLVEEASPTPLLARLLLPFMTRVFCGWHYADGVECCTSEDMARLRAAFFQLLHLVCDHFRNETAHPGEVAASLNAVDGPVSPWPAFLLSLLAAPMRPSDFRELRGEAIDALRTLRLSTPMQWGGFARRVNGDLPPVLRATTLEGALIATSLIIGGSGLTLRSTGERGTCVAPCTWRAQRRNATYYFEVNLIDLLPDAVCSIGVGLTDYSLSRMPGWDSNSYALQSDGMLFKGGVPGHVTDCSFRADDVIGCGWRVEKHEVYWSKNGKLVETCKVAQEEEFAPLIGFAGRGIIRVNFGAEAFVLQHPASGFAEQHCPQPTTLCTGHDAWDTFSALSLRAALFLKAACASSGAVDTAASFITPAVRLGADATVDHLARCVGRCLYTLSLDLRELLCRSPPVTDIARIEPLLLHCRTLVRLLARTPPDRVAPQAAQLAEVLKEGSLTLLRWAPGRADCTDLIMSLLGGWFDVMHLVPPRALGTQGTVGDVLLLLGAPSRSPPTAAREAGGVRGQTAWEVFLPTLFTLAARLCYVARDWVPGRGVHTPPPTLTARGQLAGVSWMALTLLQRLNCPSGDGEVVHSWAGALHGWLMGVLDRAIKPSSELLLALAILHGGARLVMPGDVVVLRRARHLLSRALLVSYSVSDQIAQVVLLSDEKARCKTVPLRLIDLIVTPDSDMDNFPRCGNAQHAAQARAVLALADRTSNELARGGPTVPVELAAMQAEMLAILWRCVDRGVVAVPHALLGPLMALSETLEPGTATVLRGGAPTTAAGATAAPPSLPSVERLHMDKVVLEGCLLTVQGVGAFDRMTPVSSGGVAGRVMANTDDCGVEDDGGTARNDLLFTAESSDVEETINSPTASERVSSVMENYFATRETSDAEGDDDDDEEEEMLPTPELRAELRRAFSHANGTNMILDHEDGEEGNIELEESEELTESELITGDYLYEEYDDDDTVAAVQLEPEEENTLGGYVRDGGAEEQFDGLHFSGGYLCIVASQPVGPNFTVDVRVRLLDVQRLQVLFMQCGTLYDKAGCVSRANRGAGRCPCSIVARVNCGVVEFGWVRLGDALTQSGVQGGPATALVSDLLLCRCSITSADVGQWLRLSFVQSGDSVSLYREGVLQETQRSTRYDLTPPSLLGAELYLGGSAPGVGRDPFTGDLKALHIFNTALRVAQLEQLHTFDGEDNVLPENAQSHLCIQLRATRNSFDNFARSSAALFINVLTEGDVGYLENSSSGARVRGGRGCAKEFDFGCDADETDLHAVDVCAASNELTRYLEQVQRRRLLATEPLLQSYSRCWRQLSCFYSVCLLTAVLQRGDDSTAAATTGSDVHPAATSAGLPPAPGPAACASVVVAAGCTRRVVHFALFTGHDRLCSMLEMIMRSVARGISSDTQAVSASELHLSSEALQYMLQVAQQEQHVRILESPHPYKATAKVLHEIHAPQRSFYQFFFDPRTLTSSLYLTFAADRGMSEVVVQAPAYTLTPFSLALSRVCMDHRQRTTNSQWGYKITVVYDCQPQLRAMRLFQATLDAALDGTDSLARLPFFHSTTCLELLAECVKLSTGKTRRIALACLTDLLLHPHLFTVSLPFFACLHELRHLAEKLAYRPLGTQLVQSRFVKVVYACYVMYSDALLYWSTGMNCAPSAITPAAVPVDEGAMFALWRQEQRQLYRQRGVEEHVTVQQLVESQALHVEWRPEHVCIVHSKLLRGALIATPALRAGRWYFEVRIWDTGNLFIGVLPCDCRDGARPESALLAQGERGVVAFNGHTGMLLRGGGLVEALSMPRVWQYKDHVGVVLDVTERLLHFYVNGVDTDIELPFITGADAAGSATMFYPYIALEAGQSARMNFGGYFFAYAPPHGCLPLDPAYFSVGSPLPYNQLRAFHDLTAHLLTGGRHPLPAFVHDESNPFADSQERTGPAHVAVQAPDEVQVNLLDVMNVGIGFHTVTADCAVRAGAWYYEVTLRTQGLMQIGWRLKRDAATEDGGDTTTTTTTSAPGHGVGDDAVSWGVDLFRRVLWHDGKPEAVTVPQRWAVDDVIGCALDLAHREMTFFVNGRPISGGGTLISWSFHKLPTGGGVEYVPALSLRAGNGVSLNFGSTPFKYKPDGFSALGVPDSWCERMDIYYTNEPLPIMARRHRALRELWCSLDHLTEDSSAKNVSDSGGRDVAVMALEIHRAVVRAVDAYCEETGKHYLQLTPTQLAEQLVKQGLPASQLRQAWASMEVLTALARVVQFILPLLPLNTRRVNVSTKLLLAARGLLFRSTRFGFVDAMLKETNVRTENRRIFINRAKARAPRRSIEDSVFGQTFDLMAQQMPRLFQTNKRFWSTTFLGEGAEDAGGPYREHIFEMCHELMSTLPLFVPTANNALNTGTQREAFVPAPSATNPYELAAFVFLGRLMGGAMRSEEPLSLFFPTFVWRYLCACRPLTEADFESVDCIFLRCIRELRELKRRGDAEEAFNATFDTECFVVRLSDHSTRELIPNGAAIRVTYERCEEYAAAMLQVRLHEFDIQLDKIREGMLTVIPETALLLLTPDELEHRVCGKADYKVDELRKGTIYEGLSAEDRRVLLLWQALEDATPTQRRLFLRFVAGRDRLPVRLRVLPHATELDPDRAFPRATTCFFAIELPDYSSLQVMKQRLYYSIENCVDIDTDFNARATDEREGPHLSVGTEEVNLDEITSIAFEE